jgi:glycosyltransferase involved in cell wall biosynthesis
MSHSAQVSIGVPVFNGAESLAAALDSLIGQTFRDIEIIIADNASTDATPEICRRYAEQDPRIVYHRHAATIPVGENFLFVLSRARASYFMWAAHDDLRGPDFIERLHDALGASPGAVLAIGDIVEMTPAGLRPAHVTLPEPGTSRARKLSILATNELHHVYGLWRTDRLRQVKWINNDWWADLPFMMAASMLGDFIRVGGAEFRYRTRNNRRYFALPPRPGIAGKWLNVCTRLRRVWHMARMPFIAVVSVSRMAGIGPGLWAGLLTAGKAAHSAAGYFWHWLRVQLGVLPRPEA